MRLKHGLHLAYCTNIHPGLTWAETLDSLDRWTLQIKRQLGQDGPYAIGLRLSHRASLELADPDALRQFQRWLEQYDCYVFTINGFPYGRFHGPGVKERVYLPDWSDPERLHYTLRLFDLLAQLLPDGMEGSISTLPVSFKEFVLSPRQERLIRDNLWRCVDRLNQIHERTGRKLWLGLEPEPCCYLENTAETVHFFDRLREERPQDARLTQYLGVNYDACHFAVEYEEPHQAIQTLRQNGISICKIHISNALKFQASAAALQQVAALQDEVYLHQVIVRRRDAPLARFKDLGLALASPLALETEPPAEWRVHFHVPLYLPPLGELQTTADHLHGLFELLQADPRLCSQLEMETYTWAVLPDSLRNQDVTEQIVHEYRWILQQLAKKGLA